MSIWLSLIPQLQKTGQLGIFPSHNSLTLEGPAWGVVRNASASSSAAASVAASGGDGHAVGTTCMTLAESQRVIYQHNDTIVRLEEASRYAYSYAMGITAGLGGILLLLNAVLISCICRRRPGGGRPGGSPAKEGQDGLSSGATTAAASPSLRAAGSVDFYQPSPQHQMVAAADGAGGHVHHIAPSSVGAASSLPRTRSTGQKTLLVQPRPPSGILRGSSGGGGYDHHHHHGGGHLQHHPRCSSSLSGTPVRSSNSSASSSSGSGATATIVKGAANRNSMIVMKQQHLALEDLQLPEHLSGVPPPPPAEFTQSPPPPPHEPAAVSTTVLITTQQQQQQYPRERDAAMIH